MARLNTDISSTPDMAARASTADSLYRDPTPRPRLLRASTQRDSSYSVMSPARSMNSDKENEEPMSRESTPRTTSKARRPIAPSAARLPTPSSGSSSSRNGNKRRRTDEYNIASSVDVYRDEDGIQVEQDITDAMTPTPGDEDENEDEEDDATKYYDPYQDPELRRRLRAGIRNNHREMEDNRDELIKPGNDLLLHHLKRQDRYMGKVKQTADAALDSRVMVLASDLAGKKLSNSLHGNTGVGLDLDQFVSKCIFFMRSGGSQTDDQRARSLTQERYRGQAALQEDDEDDDTGDGLDWTVLGGQACFPCNRRPPVSSFLLGPLSVQKRARTTQVRRAKSQRQPVGPATRPQELQQSDLKQSENSNLTHLVKGIKAKLEQHIRDGEERVVAELEEIEGNPDEEDTKAACRRHRVYPSCENELCVSLFDFVVNPNSFGQTVENLFYVSFLIREGNAMVTEDNHGLPLLVPSAPRSLQEQRQQNVQKHQAIFSIDYQIWKTLIEAFDIREPLIPHRMPEETNVSANGWYS